MKRALENEYNELLPGTVRRVCVIRVIEKIPQSGTARAQLQIGKFQCSVSQDRCSIENWEIPHLT